MSSFESYGFGVSGAKRDQCIEVVHNSEGADVAYVGRHDLPTMGEYNDNLIDRVVWKELSEARHEQLMARRRFLGRRAVQNRNTQFPVRPQAPLSIS